MKLATKITITFVFLFMFGKSYAQIGINSTGAAPSSNAMLDVSSNTKGALLPRMTTAQRTTLSATATDGLTVYDTDTKSYWYFKSTGSWTELATGAANPWVTSGTNINNINTGGVGIGSYTNIYKFEVNTSMREVAGFNGGPQAFIGLRENGLYRGYFGSYSGADEDVDLGTNFVNTQGKLHLTTMADPKLTITPNGNVGIGITSPTKKLHIEAGAINGIYARSTITNTDSAAITGVLDLPTGANFRVAGVRGESKSTTSNSIGVYGLHNGGGWGVAGSVKEAGENGWGAGVYGEAGLNGSASGTGGNGVTGVNINPGGNGGFFVNYNLGSASRALKTDGKLQLTNIGEADGKVLTSDINGNASWQDAPGSAWVTSGNNIYNTNTSNVGIGTTNPTAKLMIESAGAFSANNSSTDSFLRLKLTNDNNFGWMRYENSTGTRNFSQKFHLYSSTASDNSYSLYYGLDQLFNIKGDGRFGLNVANPADLLHMSSISATGDVYTRISSTTGLTGLRLQNAAGDWTMYSNEFSKMFLGYSSNNFVTTAEVITVEPTETDFNFLPSTTNQVNLGTTTNRWKTLNTNRLDVAGFSKLGDDVATPRVKMKKIVATNGATGVTSSFAHGLTQSKILSVSVFINANSLNDIAPRSTFPGFEYDMYVSSTSVVIRNIAGNDLNIAGGPIRILITYEE
jgi:hypothetical protein